MECAGDAFENEQVGIIKRAVERVGDLLYGSEQPTGIQTNRKATCARNLVGPCVGGGYGGC